MNYQELKKLLRWEFKLKTGEYLCFHLGFEKVIGTFSATVKATTSIFEIDYPLDFKTYFFCKRTINAGHPDFTIEKIVTISNDGTATTFQKFYESDFDTAFADFLDYVRKNKEVELLQTYTIGESVASNG